MKEPEAFLAGMAVAFALLIASMVGCNVKFSSAPTPSPSPLPTPWLWTIPEHDGECVVLVESVGPCFSKPTPSAAP